MRIRRSLLLVIRSFLMNAVKKVPATICLVSLLMLGNLVAQNMFGSNEVAAVIPPDSCFNYTTNLGKVTIRNYYDNEANNPANPACPKAVDIPATLGGNPVTVIGNGASTGGFSGKAITSVVIPEGVTTLANYAFYYNQLTTITLPNSLLTIGGSAFAINQLTSLSVPQGVTTISGNAFRDNVISGTVTIPNSVSTFGSDVFENNQISSVVFSGTVASFGSSPFDGNPLASLTYNGTTHVADGTVDELCFTFAAGAITKYRYSDMNLVKNSNVACIDRTFTIPTTISGVAITSIGASAFENITLGNIVIPSGVTSIGASAFRNSQLSSIGLPDTLTSINNYAFSDNRLSTITIPASVTYIGNGVFLNNLLQSVTINSTSVVYGSSILGGANADLLDSITLNGTTYSEANNNINTLNCFAFDADTHTIQNFSYPYDLESLQSQGCIRFGEVTNTHLVVPEAIGGVSVDAILGWAFSYGRLVSVELPDTITEIDEGTFYANSIESVDLPSSITSVHPTAFMYQNPAGEDIVDGSLPDVPYIWSSDPTEVQRAFESIWYVRLYTENSSSTLKNGLVSEDYWMGEDANNNGTTRDSLGGHIIAPARTVVSTATRSGLLFGESTSVVGATSSGNLLKDYTITASGSFAPLDHESITPEEQSAMDEGFAQYYKIGQTVPINAPTIDGYTRLSPVSPAEKLLSNKENEITFVYAPSVTKIDFGMPPGSPDNPTSTTPPKEASDTIKGSVFSIDEESECSVIRTAQLLSGADFTAPAGSTTIGGLDFTLDCTAPGKEAFVSLALGEPLSDVRSIKVYKKHASGVIKDITSLVNIENVSIAKGMRTVISYALTDGGSLDDDGVINGQISDPIYVTVSDDGKLLAATGVNILLYLYGAGGMTLVAGAVLLTLRLKR